MRELQRPVDRAACYVPSALAPLVSTVLMTAVPAKVAGVPEVVLVTSPQRDGTVAPGILAAAAIAGVDEVYRVGGPGRDRRPGLRHRVDPPGRRHRRARAARASRRPSARSRRPGWSACRAPSPGRPRSWWSPTRRTPVAWAAIDVVLQAEHGPDGLAWLITWDEAVADAVAAAVAEIVPRSPRREHLEATLAEGGYVVLCDGPEQAIAVANAIAPEHLELLSADPEALLPLCATPARCSAAPTRRRRSATTSPGPTTCCPPTARPASRARCGWTTSSSTSTSSRSTRRPWPRWPSTSIALATYEGLDAHAESIRLRQGPS